MNCANENPNALWISSPRTQQKWTVSWANYSLSYLIFFTEKWEIEYPVHDTVMTLLVHIKIHDKKNTEIFLFTHKNCF